MTYDGGQTQKVMKTLARTYGGAACFDDNDGRVAKTVTAHRASEWKGVERPLMRLGTDALWTRPTEQTPKAS